MCVYLHLYMTNGSIRNNNYTFLYIKYFFAKNFQCVWWAWFIFADWFPLGYFNLEMLEMEHLRSTVILKTLAYLKILCCVYTPLFRTINWFCNTLCTHKSRHEKNVGTYLYTIHIRWALIFLLKLERKCGWLDCHAN